MNIHCFKCNKKFVPNSVNTKIYGPYVEVSCPFCVYVYEGKLLNFVDRQLEGYRLHSHHDAIRMQHLAKFIELNSSDYYKKRGLRHGTKKVRNIPT